MNFIEAMKLLKLDKNIKVMRRNSNFQIMSDTLGICTLDFAIEDVISNPIVEAMLTEDWYVVKDEKLHTFEEALKAYKSGKRISRVYGKLIHDEDYCSFERDDVMANDWIIIDKEETK